MSTIRSLIWFVLAAGVALTIWGLTHMSWPSALPFDDPGLRRYLAFLLVCSILVVIGAKFARYNLIVVGCVIGIVFALLASELWALLVTVWFALSSIVVGRFIHLLLLLEVNKKNWMAYFLVGSGAYGTAVGLLAHFPVSYPGVYGVALAVPLIFGWRTIMEIMGGWRSINNVSQDIGSRRLDCVIVVVALIHLVLALMPELGYDALVMHLFVPSQLFLRHQWGFDAATYAWAVMPMLGDWIFSIGYMLAGETAARLINVGFIFSLGWLIREIVLWAGGTAVGARWAILIYLSLPLTITESSNLFIESVWATFVIAGTIATLRVCSTNENQRQGLLLAGIYLGYALAAKAVTMVNIPILLFILIWRYKIWFRANLYISALLGAMFFVGISCVPYVTAWVLTGNPIFPLYNEIFKSSLYPLINFSDHRWKAGISWKIIYSLTFQSGSYLEARPGVAGFQWLTLLTPSFLITILLKDRRRLILFIIGSMWLILTFHFESYLRYVFPSFVILSAAIGAGITLMPSVLFRAITVVAAIVVGLNLLFINAGPNGYNDFPISSLLSYADRELYLQKRLPIRNAIDLINRLNVRKMPVAFFSAPFGAGLSSDALYPNWYNHQFEALIQSSKNNQELAKALQSKNVNYIILNSAWGSVEKRTMIEDVTDKVAEFGAITVRSLRQSYLFKTELLKGTEFSPLDDWSLKDGAVAIKSGEIVVSEPSYAVQLVPVKQEGRYLNSVKARCSDKPAQGRTQVNWLDKNYHFINTDIRVFDCTFQLAEYSMEVVAPANAAYAAVFVSGNTEDKLIFKEASFRQ